MRLESRRDLLRLGALSAVSAVVPACSEASGDDGRSAGDGLTGAGKGGHAGKAGSAVTGTSGKLNGTGGAGAGGKKGHAGMSGTGGTGAAGGAPGMNRPGFPTIGSCGSSLPALPEPNALVSIPKLPDPFKLGAGTRITTKAEWACRRAELKALAEKYVYGVMPPKPGSVTATPMGNKLFITCTEGGKSITFSITVSKPSNAAGPAPAIIGLNGSSLGGVPAGIGSITFDNNQLAEQAN
jgi:hypothetical protein